MLNKTQVTSIVAVDANYGIGYQNNILFHNKIDMKHFVTITKNIGICVMGRKTYESLLPNLLKDRKCIVFSTQNKPQDCQDDSIWIKTIDELKIICEPFFSICVIGGGEIYDLLSDYTDTWFITHFVQAADNVDTALSLKTRYSIINKESSDVLVSNEDIVIKQYF